MESFSFFSYIAKTFLYFLNFTIMTKSKQSPPVLAAQKERKEYHKPTFEVIYINMESPLLSGSNIGKKAPINPLTPGGDL